jgi:pyridoxamine 5'-phosphate oxidase family protein
MGSSQRYRNVQRDSRAAFVIDDTTPGEEADFKPGVGRGIELRGRAGALADQEPPALAAPGFRLSRMTTLATWSGPSWSLTSPPGQKHGR